MTSVANHIFSQKSYLKIAYTQRNLMENMCIFVVIVIPVDSLAPLGDTSSDNDLSPIQYWVII